MNIHIKTAAENCHITVKIKIGSKTLLSLTDNDEGFVQVMPSINYTFEWHVFTGSKTGKVNIGAQVAPSNNGFPPFLINREYPAGIEDGGIFGFNLN